MKFITREGLVKTRPQIAFPADFRLKDHLREVGTQGDNRIYEFIGTDTFSSEWNTRQQFEINAGRDEEPLLYQPLYRIVSDASLPRNVSTYFMGPGGVVFEQVFEGGEVKFATITSSSQTVPINHWAIGLE